MVGNFKHKKVLQGDACDGCLCGLMCSFFICLLVNFGLCHTTRTSWTRYGLMNIRTTGGSRLFHSTVYKTKHVFKNSWTEWVTSIFIVILNLILRCAGFRKSCSTCPKGVFWRVFRVFNFILFIHHQITTTVARGRPYNNTTEKTPNNNMTPYKQATVEKKHSLLTGRNLGSGRGGHLP